ncbi:MAG: hypothetical protein ACUVRZ_08370 [Desulfobacca sp.]|uniref:hypothetical protein n=1 Tax=Desulfobacca sp. TaxID=2067990 RepID=UPI004049EE19
MGPTYLWYQVQPSEELPAGMAAVTLTVLSPIWQGVELTIDFPDGWRQILRGRTAAGRSCALRVFWSEVVSGGPPVCLAIGGDGGLQLREGYQGAPARQQTTSVRPLLGLATALIPSGVRQVIGPEPGRSPRLLG